MIRRTFLQLGMAAPCVPLTAEGRPPIPEPHFPNRLYQFVWRNWEIANTDRMAAVAGCRAGEILALGEQMGLPKKPALTPDQLRRIHITAIRQNWHLLPNAQIVQLLGWTPEKFAYTLREDDFLDVKLGPKPDCEPVKYRAPDQAARARAAEIRATLTRVLGKELYAPGEPPFDFIRQLSERGPALPPEASSSGKAAFDLRYLYPFFALYGDPLLEPEIDPFPDGYLEKLATVGINGVWMQSILSNMAPSRLFPEFGKRSDERLANLDKLTARLEKFGMRAMLYVNEPRAMPPAFFKGREKYRGVSERGFNAICTTPPEVREWMSDALAHVFKRAPRLGGMFTITMSENLTSCHSHYHPESCPRCAQRKSWDVVGEVLEAFRSGVRRSSKSADVIAWDWAWRPDLSQNLIPKLRSDMRFMSVSEWSTPIERGGVKSEVGEYSISVVGPGPRATANWALAKKAGVRTMAKTQFNATWEISAVPYIPVPNLIARHCAGLVKAGVSGIQASWTVGGYPSPNLEVAKEFYFGAKTPEEVLERVARRRYGDQAAGQVLKAWQAFSDAFEGFPYSTVPGYIVPTQHGPANLLRMKPTGVRGSMILFPQDDYKRWAGPYPPTVARDLFARMAERWEPGIRALDHSDQSHACRET